jgi:hypothetical protein
VFRLCVAEILFKESIVRGGKNWHFLASFISYEMKENGVRSVISPIGEITDFTFSKGKY